jgi:hypothetical protein
VTHANNTPTDATGQPLTIDAARAVRDTRANREAAYRERAGLIGALASCICVWPLAVYPSTVSGHHEACPAETMIANDVHHRRCAWVTG